MLETVIVLNWKIYANAQPQYEFCFVTHFNLVLGSHKRPALLISLPTAKVSAVRCVHFTSLTSRKQWGLSEQRDGKALASQTSLGSGPRLDQFGAT